jgi:hypothetical protein
VEELKRQMRREVLGDLRPILEALGLQFPDIGGFTSDKERRSSLASTVARGGPSIESDMIDNLAQPIAYTLILLVGESFRMEVRRGLVYPHQTMLDDVQIGTSSYAVVKVEMVHDNSKDLKLEVPPDETMLTIRDAVTRRVQLRWTSIDIDPLAAASVSTTPSQPNNSPASMSLEAHLSPIQNQLCLSPISEQLCSSPIRDQPQKSPIEEQPHWSPPQTCSTPLAAPDQMKAKAMKNVRGKSHPLQRKIFSKATKGKKPVKELEANPKLLVAMMQANPKFVIGKPMLTVDTLKLAGKSCVELHNYYINNCSKGQDIIVSYKDQHFLVGDDIFLILWSDLYNFFNLDTLDVSLIHCFAL